MTETDYNEDDETMMRCDHCGRPDLVSNMTEACGQCPQCVADSYPQFINDTGNPDNLTFQQFKDLYDMNPQGEPDDD